MVGKHLRRDRFCSPFISLSPSLIWVLHKALESTVYEEADKICIAIIDGTTVAQDQVWHARPLLSQVKAMQNSDTYLWPELYRRYKAASEWLVYGEVKEIAATVRLSAVLKLAAAVQPCERILRPDIISSCKNVWQIQKHFHSNRVLLDWDTIIGLAKLLTILHIFPDSSLSTIEAGVYAIMHGFAIFVKEQDMIHHAFEEWVFHHVKQQEIAEECDLAGARSAFSRAIESSQRALHSWSHRHACQRSNKKVPKNANSCDSDFIVDDADILGDEEEEYDFLDDDANVSD